MTTTVKRSTPKLDALAKMLEEFSRSNVAVTVELPANEQAKVGWLKDRARDLLLPNRDMGLAFVRFAKAGLATVLASNGVLTAEKILEAGVGGLKSHVLLRLRQGKGNDAHFRPLTPRYLAAKLRAGFPANIGIRTGDLYAALDRARWSVRRR